MHADSRELEGARAEATAALEAWDFAPDTWQLVGALSGSLGSELRPVIALDGARYVLRRQPPDLHERDIQFRHDFMAHLGAEGLPVPRLLPRPGGATYALVAGEFYELQEWRPGAAYRALEAGATARAEAAAATLGTLHQASALYAGAPQMWPEERSPHALARSYLDLLATNGQRAGTSPAVAAAVARVVEAATERAATAEDALAVTPGPPELHIHGDYQPRNVAYDGDMLAAIYDFDAVRWARRLDELAYALLGFAALGDDDGRAPMPLAADGLDAARANAFLRAYGQVAPPAEDEAPLLGDAITLAFPVLLVNGLLEDLVFLEDFSEAPTEHDLLARLEWADAFWVWLDRYRGVLAESWQTAMHEPPARPPQPS
ncbi:MAG TPA: phosphotransferase [Ktedonobacterales bacterium]|nr:phosphotransferase [Ktedonobacterales bacterium]